MAWGHPPYKWHMGQLPGRSMGDKQASGLLVPVGQKILQLGVSSWVLRGIYTQQLLSPARGALWGMRSMASSWCLSSQWISRGPASVPRLSYAFVVLFPAPQGTCAPSGHGHPGCSFLAWHTFLPRKDPPHPSGPVHWPMPPLGFAAVSNLWPLQVLLASLSVSPTARRQSSIILPGAPSS